MAFYAGKIIQHPAMAARLNLPKFYKNSSSLPKKCEKLTNVGKS
ncbi:hypothetical protein COO91_06567 [Nostoc flagelliforme CCNUN1]|uniref:Uncharacterized protein n=1 Tax=Nostoc flagelliforme CCNUN1 TaxID=2038116 RepID=A0A2K8SYT5_9NOSO|nr:hypothetical protein COO91_06567 [Nostoc flagelliforme CCNUN1]